MPPVQAPGSSVVRNAAIARPKSFLFTLLGAGTLAASYWFMKDSYEGRKPEVERLHSVERSQDNWAYWKATVADYSGFPTMDKVEFWLKGLAIYGPLNIFAKIRAMETTAADFVENVFLPNIIPVGLGIASLYIGLGSRIVHWPFRKTAEFWTNHSLPPTFKQKLGEFMSYVGRGIGTGLGNLVSLPFNHGLRGFGISAVIAGLGLFFVNRLESTADGSAQHAFFREQILSKD